jgi:hypothetical protein
MVRKLTGKNVAAVIAGNPFFHPFAWEKICLFMVEYDAKGRIVRARQVPVGTQQKSEMHAYEFDWDGDTYNLNAIREKGTGDYTRSMSYQGGKLAGENISYNNGHSKIEYKYKGNILAEADCTSDPSLEGRSRHVVF